MADTFTFVVRIWREPATVAAEMAEYRGEVKDVITGETRSFRLLDGLHAVLRAFMEKTNGRLP